MNQDRRNRIIQIANWQRDGLCIFCGDERLKNRRACQKCCSEQYTEARKINLIKIDKTFNCKDCWEDFPKYRESQTRCRSCYLEPLRQIMRKQVSNNS